MEAPEPIETQPESTAPAIPTAAPRRLPAPYVTLALCVICAFVFAAVRRGDPDTWRETLGSWGALPAQAVWNGGYWSLLTSAFVHVAVIHVLMNVYWLWTLGRFVELVLGPWRLIVLTVVSAVVSSGLQLAVSDTTGIGASGVVYALFGVMWGARRKVPLFGHIMGQVAYVFWIWLPVGYLLTRLELLNIGNAAHLGGLLTGVVAARELFFAERRRLAHAAAALLLAAAIVPLFWAPWSAAWIGHRATLAHADGRYDEALAGYLKALAMGADRVWLLQNIALARHAKGDDAGYAAALAQLRRLSPDAADRLAAEVGEGKDRPATSDQARIHAVWHYTGALGPTMSGPVTSDRKRVAADIELPASQGFDLDDIDIVDADTGTNHGSFPYIQRLTAAGERVDDRDPAVKDRPEYRAIFVWAVPAGVTRVNFAYWGEMLFVKPIVIAASGPTLPAAKVEATALHRLAPEEGFERYVVVVRALHWSRVEEPGYFTIHVSSAPMAAPRCRCERWIEIDGRSRPLSEPLEKRPYYVDARSFVMEYWCRDTVRPDTIGFLSLTAGALPKATPLDLPPLTLEALAAAPRRPRG